MSLILDALKKSEEKRQLGQAPTLGSSIVSTRRRRNMLPYIIAAIVLVALIGLWQFNRYKHSHNKGSTPATSAVQSPATTTPATSANVNRAAPPTGAAAAATSPAPNAAAPTNKAAAPPIAINSRRPTALANAPTAAPPPKATTTPVAPVPVAPTARAAPPSAKPLPPTTSPPTASAPTATAANVANAAAPDNIRAPASAVAANPDAKPIQAYYELPFPVRKDLPAIKISMHVYAVDPAQRFIVVNNVHQGEGDSIEGGVTVREIRPTDIVLEFQGKIFSVPRTGI
ncbi:hypothetical protein ELE36_18550 [Pseudolysobacter antarcticus]|uniref:Type II secretion system protein GspB C-terminal domain-containing protein n=1 Tax=Pseudolysobacter antarcticus TaxID=2511995 RepID=A0A411HNZ4_9GAMM|nr:general secretion pathway protein GspB [Pseudolysobacter antarcticus]QBB72205.1 hypothetical protein ELE36_18550 [Pseudolysobacter antarcticus]